ncbi:MAG: hypothetical protein PHU85_13495, partial [Phycisphaerae bacterium]|nr:hypothetical protein [Phycisphaerae bacterium]
LLAAGYGTLCYYFVRFLLFLALLCAHWSVSIFAPIAGRGDVREGASKWDLLWPSPTFENFNTQMSTVGLNMVDSIGGWLVHLWVMLVGAVLIAWVVSYLLSASTLVYLLLRKAEDATDLTEVYIEEPAEEPPAQPAAAAATGEAAVTAPAPAAPATPPAPAPTDTPPSGDAPKV